MRRPPTWPGARLPLVAVPLIASAIAATLAAPALAASPPAAASRSGDCQSVVSLNALADAVAAAAPPLGSPGGFARAQAAVVAGLRGEHRELATIAAELSGGSAAAAASTAVSRAYAAFARRATDATDAGGLTAAFADLERSPNLYPASVVVTSALLKPCVSGLTPPPDAAADPDYLDARAQWEGEGPVGGGALQDIPFFLAAADLQRTLSRQPGEHGYLAALAALDGFEAVPDAMLTPAENRLESIATKALTRFFAAAISAGSTQTSPFRTAAADWEGEPARRLDLRRGPLRQALAALDAGARADPRETAYAAPVVDLQALLDATPAELAADSGGFSGAEITYLNTVFGQATEPGSSYRPVLDD